MSGWPRTHFGRARQETALLVGLPLRWVPGAPSNPEVKHRVQSAVSFLRPVLEGPSVDFRWRDPWIGQEGLRIRASLLDYPEDGGGRAVRGLFGDFKKL